MKKSYFVFTIFLFLTLSVTGQLIEPLNQTDPSGKKQGHWIKKYGNGNIQYDGFFKDDKPIGNFKRFYEDAQIRSLQIFSQDGRDADVVFYHQNGFIAASGKYINEKKEGIWKTYSANFEKYLISEEEYSDDKRINLSIKYYPDGAILEKAKYENDIRNGECIQYYDDGKIALHSYYTEGKLNGPFDVFFIDGSPQFRGQYKNDVRDGLWKIYNEDGTLKYDIIYENGIVNNPEVYKIESDYLDELEKNKGKIKEPDFSDIQ